VRSRIMVFTLGLFAANREVVLSIEASLTPPTHGRARSSTTPRGSGACAHTASAHEPAESVEPRPGRGSAYLVP
jgi:hypothetical protein